MMVGIDDGHRQLGQLKNATQSLGVMPQKHLEALGLLSTSHDQQEQQYEHQALAMLVQQALCPEQAWSTDRPARDHPHLALSLIHI